MVLLWNDFLPSYQPAFAEVREKVATAYKETEKSKRFVANGQMLQAKLSAAVKAGTPFEKAAADAKLEVAVQTIHHGGTTASRLILPVIARP